MVSVSVSSAAGWAGASQAGRTALQFATTVILARLLAPGDYGLMAMALAISALGAVFRDLGTGTALIQRTGLDDRVINGIFRLNLALGLALSILCIAGAGPFAQLLGEPRLAAVLVLMSPIFLVSSVGVVPQALLERESRFKDLAGIELAAAALAASVAVAAAASGFRTLRARGANPHHDHRFQRAPFLAQSVATKAWRFHLGRSPAPDVQQQLVHIQLPELRASQCRCIPCWSLSGRR